VLTADFDFALPEAAIAQRARPRGTSRLFVLDREPPDRHLHVGDLPRLLRPGDLLVVNDTRVIPARLFAQRGTAPATAATADLAAGPAPTAGATVELLLVDRVGACEWDALVRPGRRAHPGTRLWFPPAQDGTVVHVEVLATSADGRRRVRFSEPIEPHLERLGHVPLPPYIHRADEAADRDRYQTVWAREPGAIAAPTAGLHFDQALLERLTAAGISRAAVTLHVGIGTFKPVTAELVHEHRMETERYQISAATAEQIAATRARGGRIVAVGTTVVRTLEAAALAAGDPERAAETLPVGSGRADLFITPGFRFRVVDLLITNFHLPRSTLLMLVAAFAGRERVLAAYAEAVREGYLFYSYGDAMLLERRPAGATDVLP
jgi:S-adenosylmethionine:tRNA ribosyltransferase-isomerase